MLGSSITLTVNGVAKAMNLINQDNYSGEYLLQEATEEWRLKVSHAKMAANRVTGVVYNRHVADFTHTTYAVAGVSPEVYNRVYTTWIQKDGDSVSTNYISSALSTYLTASSGAKTVAILGWES
nr:MAG: putative coat protein [Leviviridae sp.]